MTDKHPGRPLKTTKDLPVGWSELTIEMYAEGASDVEIKAMLHIYNDLWTRWLKDEPEFSETIKYGKQLSQAWWESKKARTFIELEYEELMQLGVSTAIFALKNFGWRDTQEVKHDASDKFAEAVARAKEIAIKHGGASE
jgi:hypothetical protein